MFDCIVKLLIECTQNKKKTKLSWKQDFEDNYFFISISIFSSCYLQPFCSFLHSEVYITQSMLKNKIWNEVNVERWW